MLVRGACGCACGSYCCDNFVGGFVCFWGLGWLLFLHFVWVNLDVVVTCPAFRVGCGPGGCLDFGCCGLVCFDSGVSDLV